MLRVANEAVLRARALRRVLSPPEAKLWSLLRKRPEGLKFRHQHPAGPYTLDFYYAAARLGIELDGASHDMGDNPARDARRDAWLLKQGIRIIRFAAQDVMRDPESVVTAICQAAAAHPPHRKMGRGTTRRVVEG
ncbi:MAG TPA: endonuclease domain-containing protein [Allosphingosinicella sp.]